MTRKRSDDGETGMILVNVLMMVAIAAGLVLLMISREELSLDRGIRLREAARAMAIVRGGELSAVVALRRDLVDSPESDHVGEAWARLSESGAPIDGGSFDLAIADAEGRFNINNVRGDQISALLLFRRIAEAVGLNQEQTIRIVGLVRAGEPVTDLRPLRQAGLDPAIADRLERLVTALPGTTTININAADQELLALLWNDPVAAERLVGKRQRTGFLTPQDLTTEQLSLPPGTSFRSSSFWVRTRATIGGTSQESVSLIQRRSVDGRPQVRAVERWRGAAVPPGAPQFP